MKRYDKEEVGPAYQQCTMMVEQSYGDWVYYDDVAALVELNNKLIKMASGISQMCVGDLAMGHRLDAQAIGEYIYSVTGLNSEELIKKAKELQND